MRNETIYRNGAAALACARVKTPAFDLTTSWMVGDRAKAQHPPAPGPWEASR